MGRSTFSVLALTLTFFTNQITFAFTGDGLASDLSTLMIANGPALSTDDLNTGLAPKRGFFVWNVGNTNYCVVEHVRSLESLPASMVAVRGELKALSFGKDGSFAEAACWVFVYQDGTMDLECVRLGSATFGSSKEINAPLQKLIGRSQAGHQIRKVVMIHTHPTTFDTRHFGPSQSDLGLHISMDQQFEIASKLPLGSYISLVFPVDKEDKTDFFYSVNSFRSTEKTCPKNPGE